MLSSRGMSGLLSWFSRWHDSHDICLVSSDGWFSFQVEWWKGLKKMFLLDWRDCCSFLYAVTLQMALASVQQHGSCLFFETRSVYCHRYSVCQWHQSVLCYHTVHCVSVPCSLLCNVVIFLCASLSQCVWLNFSVSASSFHLHVLQNGSELKLIWWYTSGTEIYSILMDVFRLRLHFLIQYSLANSSLTKLFILGDQW